jgi:hypothetical protein
MSWSARHWLAIALLPAIPGFATDRLPQFRKEQIPQTQGVSSISVVDLNDDGKPDILAAGGRPTWFQNPGWAKRVISETASQNAFGVGARRIGWIHSIRRMARVEAGALVVYEQPTQPLNAQQNTKLRPTPIPDGTWKREVVDPREDAHAMVWGDMDGDGSDELVASSRAGIAFYKLMYDGRWRKTPVDSTPAAELAAADLNGDGFAEVVASGPEGLQVYWNEYQPLWSRHVIMQGFRTQSAVAADFTGHGRMDVISGDIENDRNIYLYSAPDWKPKLLHSGIRLIQSEAFDVDGDGDIDFIGAQYRPGLVFWLERPKDPLHDPWPFHLIDDFTKGGIDGVHSLLAADIDRDGRLDLVANSGWPDGSFPNSLAWFRVPAQPRTAERWERRIFADRDAPGLSHYLGAGDVNGDGRLDLAIGAKIKPEGNWFAWWEQPADPVIPWKKHMIVTGQEGATNIVMADVNGDGKPDFIASRGHGKGLVWYEAPDWRPHEIDPELVGPHSLAAADLDGDGDIDFVTCAKDARICAWFENDGKGNFAIHHIAENQASYQVRLVDMNGDGALDILVAGQESQNVVWFENRIKRR